MENNIGKTIVGFKTGRGGSFWNAGHVSFIGECNINDFTNELFLRYENEHSLYEKIDGRKHLLEKYEDCQYFDDFTFFTDKGFDLGEKVYSDCNGRPVGLTEKEANEGIGVIDIDGEYNTIVCEYLEDLSESQYQLIIDSENQAGYFCDKAVIQYAKEALGFAQEA